MHYSPEDDPEALRYELRRLRAENERLRCEYDPNADGAQFARAKRWIGEVAKVADNVFRLDGCCHWEDVCKGIERLHAIVDKLPTCWQLADGKREQTCPVVPGMPLHYVAMNGDGVLSGRAISMRIETVVLSKPRPMAGPITLEYADCYSTRAAAEEVARKRDA